MRQPESWPPLRWRSAAFVFSVTAAVVFVLVFNLWPESARSTIVRAASFAAVLGFVLLFGRFDRRS